VLSVVVFSSVCSSSVQNCHCASSCAPWTWTLAGRSPRLSSGVKSSLRISPSAACRRPSSLTIGRRLRGAGGAVIVVVWRRGGELTMSGMVRCRLGGGVALQSQGIWFNTSVFVGTASVGGVWQGFCEAVWRILRNRRWVRWTLRYHTRTGRPGTCYNTYTYVYTHLTAVDVSKTTALVGNDPAKGSHRNNQSRGAASLIIHSPSLPSIVPLRCNDSARGPCAHAIKICASHPAAALLRPGAAVVLR
jgi:hypothetical protein